MIEKYHHLVTHRRNQTKIMRKKGGKQRGWGRKGRIEGTSEGRMEGRELRGKIDYVSTRDSFLDERRYFSFFFTHFHTNSISLQIYR